MTMQRGTTFGFWAAVVLLFSLTACQRKCQQPTGERISSLSETQWRLVETTDPQIQNLDRFNFIIMSFRRNFTGEVQQVEFNDLIETPVATFEWNPIEKGYMVMRYQFNSASGGSQQTEYDYSLRSELEMYERKTNNYYRYVPFQGVVDPDSTCVF